MENLGRYLNITNESDKAYRFGGWPIITQEDVDAYRTWFDKEWVVDKPLYADPSSSSSSIDFSFINNILIPKPMMKINMKQNIIFYIRHLISLDDVKISTHTSSFVICALHSLVKTILYSIPRSFIR
jgi:hypothetical protein